MITKCERCKQTKECKFHPLRHQLVGPDADEDECTDGILLCSYCLEHFEAEVEAAVEFFKQALDEQE